MIPGWAIVDIGNSVVKCGLIASLDFAGPPRFLRLADAPLDAPERLAATLQDFPERSWNWFVSSVNRPAEGRLREWLARERPHETYHQATYVDCPLMLRVDRPELVGFDRLATAVAADARRPASGGAIVVDAGTALKVHAVTAAGEFLGGVIMPGFRLAAQSLQRGTDLLPLVDASLNIAAPDVFGRNTQAAIQGGLYWGALGAVREVVTRMRSELGEHAPVYVTGGDARGLAALLDQGFEFVGQLCLEGLVHVARHVARK